MERPGSPKVLFENVDLSPLHFILWKDLHVEGAGRPVEYEPECDYRALLLRQLEQIPYVKDLVKRLNRYMQDNRRGFGDPDARLGRGKRGFVLGYQSLFLVDIEGFPLGHVEAPVNVNEKMLVARLLAGG